MPLHKILCQALPFLPSSGRACYKRGTQMTKRANTRRPPLGVMLSDVTPRQLARLKALERYDISFVEDRLARDGGCHSTSIADAVLGFKRYMALAALGFRGLPVPSPEVDDVWHAFLLFTREYSAFCRDAVGFFVHHTPTTREEPQDSLRASQVYERVFGAQLREVGHCNACTSCRATSNAETRP